MTQQYIGRKIVTGWPSAIEECNCKAHENAACARCGKPREEGYGVKYADGYTSWSPRDAFELAYLPIGHIEHLPHWHQRLIGERALLDDDIQRLDRFMDTPAFAELSQEHGYLLQLQLEAMFRYRDLLDQRLELSGTPAPRRTLNTPAVATGD